MAWFVDGRVRRLLDRRKGWRSWWKAHIVDNVIPVNGVMVRDLRIRFVPIPKKVFDVWIQEVSFVLIRSLCSVFIDISYTLTAFYCISFREEKIAEIDESYSRRHG